MNRLLFNKFFGVLCLLFFLVACNSIVKEHEEASKVNISDIDFQLLNEGVYDGYYNGGMNKWRENKCTVSISTIGVDSIELVFTAETNFPVNILYQRIIENQSLQIDSITGATLSSKAHLKSVEDALLKAIY